MSPPPAPFQAHSAPLIHPYAPAPARPAWLNRENLFFALALGVFLLTRLIHLDGFPIYFYSDEAVPVIRALHFLRDGFKDYNGVFLPTFFLNDSKYSLGTTVYLQLLPLLAFGKSVWAARGVTVLAGLLGMVWAGLTLRDIFKVRFWWAGVLLMGLSPAWFLLSRTALETPVMTALFAGFLYYYLRYRTGRLRSLYPALVLGALAFYTYFPGQVVVVLTAALLLFTDLPYHWKNRRVTLPAALLLIVLALPLVRFFLQQPGEYTARLSHYGSYLVDPTLSPAVRAQRYLTNYLTALSPAYWFNPATEEPVWWKMKGYGNLWLPALPFLLYGFYLALRRFRRPEMRALLFAWLAGPAAAATVAVEITRCLSMLVPLSLMAGLGLSAALDWLDRRTHRTAQLSWLVFALLAGSSGVLTADALIHGPTWTTRYGLDGMQYGGEQLSAYAQRYHRHFPNTVIHISGAWSWQVDAVSQFFLPNDFPRILGSTDPYATTIDPLLENSLFILTPEEYQQAASNPIFRDVRIENIIPCPDQSPCYYAITLRYQPNAQAMLDAEKAERHRLVSEPLQILGQDTNTQHTLLNAGPLSLAFDGDTGSFIRSESANPLVFDILFSDPPVWSSVRVLVGSEKLRLTLRVDPGDGGPPVEVVQDGDLSDGNKELTLSLGGPTPVHSLHLEVLDVNEREGAPVHLWEVQGTP